MTNISLANLTSYSNLASAFAPAGASKSTAISGKFIKAHQLKDYATDNNATKESTQKSEFDYNAYYTDGKFEDFLYRAGSGNSTQSNNTMNNTMISAIKNGYSVNEACNLKTAEMAYKTNANVLKVGNEISSFAVDV